MFLGDEDVEQRHSQLHEEELVGEVRDVRADLQADIADQPHVSKLKVRSQDAHHKICSKK